MHGVDVSDIVYGCEHMGLYFVEKGASQRALMVIYDRKNSSIATVKTEDFDSNRILSHDGYKSVAKSVAE